MMMFGLAEFMVLALLTSGSAGTDLVAFIQPRDYFQSRDIAVSFDKMMELITNEPKDAKSQILQLTAFRYLADESEKLKKSTSYKDYREIIESVANGKEGQDSLGFAKEYATSLLAKLDGKKPAENRPNLLREDAAAWFPADSSLLLAFDAKAAHQTGAGAGSMQDLLKLMPEDAKNMLFNFADQSGNVRVEGFALAFADNEKDRGAQKMMVRFTGKAKREWLANAFQNMSQGMFQMRESKDHKETPITILRRLNSAPIILLVGNTDMLAVGYGKNDGLHEEVSDAILAARDKKKPNASAGILKDHLSKIPDKAFALFVGEVPHELKQQFGQLGVTPAKIVAHFAPDQKGLDVNLETKQANADDAMTLVHKIAVLRKEGVEALKQAQQQPPPPNFPFPIPYQAMIGVMENMQVQNQGERVLIRIAVPSNFMQQMFGKGAAPAEKGNN